MVVAKIIPEDVDWVWFMGDDDYLTSNESVSALHSLILNENQDLSFVHVCQKEGLMIQFGFIWFCKKPFVILMVIMKC